MIYVLRILLNHTKKVMEEGEEKNISKILGQSIFQWIIYFAFFFKIYLFFYAEVFECAIIFASRHNKRKCDGSNSARITNNFL